MAIKSSQKKLSRRFGHNGTKSSGGQRSRSSRRPTTHLMRLRWLLGRSSGTSAARTKPSALQPAPFVGSASRGHCVESAGCHSQSVWIVARVMAATTSLRNGARPRRPRCRTATLAGEKAPESMVEKCQRQWSSRGRMQAANSVWCTRRLSATPSNELASVCHR